MKPSARSCSRPSSVILSGPHGGFHTQLIVSSSTRPAPVNNVEFPCRRPEPPQPPRHPNDDHEHRDTGRQESGIQPGQDAEAEAESAPDDHDAIEDAIAEATSPHEGRHRDHERTRYPQAYGLPTVEVRCLP